MGFIILENYMHCCVQGKAVIKAEDSNFMEQLGEYSREINELSPHLTVLVLYV